MQQAGLARRVQALELRLAELETQLQAVTAHNGRDWQRAVEKYTDDEDLKHVFATALKLREADRKRARRSRGKSR